MSKYNSRKTVIDGIKFDSVKEANRYAELKLMERAGLISHLQRQVKFELIPKCGKERSSTYIADFVYQENGSTVVEDVKGVKTPEYILKRKLMNWVHDIQIKEI